MPYWYGAELESQFEVAGGAADFQAGQKVRITGRLRENEFSLTVVVTRYEWGRLLEWRFHDAHGIRGLQRWEMETIAPVAPGSEAVTRVRMRDEYEFPGWFGRLFDWLVTRHGVARRDREYLARLNKLAEGNRAETA